MRRQKGTRDRVFPAPRVFVVCLHDDERWEEKWREKGEWVVSSLLVVSFFVVLFLSFLHFRFPSLPFVILVAFLDPLSLSLQLLVPPCVPFLSPTCIPPSLSLFFLHLPFSLVLSRSLPPVASYAPVHPTLFFFSHRKKRGRKRGGRGAPKKKTLFFFFCDKGHLFLCPFLLPSVCLSLYFLSPNYLTESGKCHNINKTTTTTITSTCT